MADLSSDALQTLIIMWVLTWVAMVLMILRLIMRKVRRQRFEVSDFVTMACMVCLLARNGMVHIILIWGTNLMTPDFRASHTFNADEIYQREIGSQLTVVNRLFYNSYIWLQKIVVMCLYKRFLYTVPWAKEAMKYYWVILAATYVAVQVVTLVECRPIYLYWQVLPDPGVCIEALLQLVVLGALNILTDVMLLVLPMPTLIKLNLSIVKRIQLLIVFSVGILAVVVTIARLPQNYDNELSHVNRLIWGSVEVVAAAFVANVPTLYSLRRRTKAPAKRGVEAAVGNVQPRPMGRGLHTIGVSTLEGNLVAEVAR